MVVETRVGQRSSAQVDYCPSVAGQCGGAVIHRLGVVAVEHSQTESFSQYCLPGTHRRSGGSAHVSREPGWSDGVRQVIHGGSCSMLNHFGIADRCYGISPNEFSRYDDLLRGLVWFLNAAQDELGKMPALLFREFTSGG
jgi:hypothetical protein